MSKNDFYKENDDLLYSLLNKRFFEPWKENYNLDFNIDQTSLANDSHLELFITSTCNQKCEYCYLVKHPELYPLEINNKENILNNLRLLLNWCIENKYAIKTTDIFTGEIWHTSFGEQVLEEILQAIKRGFRTRKIVIPSNCSFIRNQKSLQVIQQYIYKYMNVGVNLVFSISIDGKPVEETSRPLNDINDVKNDDFYELLFSFARHNKFLFHPMVSPYNVDKWIENFLWWETMIKEFNGNIETDVMMLEVRDGPWTDEAIKHYKDFLNFLIDKKVTLFKNNIENLSRALFFIDTNDNFDYPESLSTGYVPYCFPEANSFPGCSISNYLTVRLGDLAICPCHRTCYDKYLYGKFEIENGKIEKITSINPQFAIKILLGNQKFNLGCTTCIFKDYCLKGCYGAQIEANKDPLVTIPTICNFFKEKYLFLLKKYQDLGVIDYLKTVNPYSPSYLRIQNFLNFYEGVKKQYELD